MRKIIFVFLLVLTVNCYSQELKPVKITPENIEAERAKHKAWDEKNASFIKIAENIHIVKSMNFDDWETKTFHFSAIVNDFNITDKWTSNGARMISGLGWEFTERLAVKKMMIKCFTKKEIEFLRNKGGHLSITANGNGLIRALGIDVWRFDLQKELKIRHVQKFFKLLEGSKGGKWKPGTGKGEEGPIIRGFYIDYFFTNDHNSYMKKRHKEKLEKAKK